MEKRILVVEFKHETNSFSPIPANRAAFESVALLFGNDMFKFHLGVESEVGAFMKLFSNRPGFKLYPCISFGACPSGPVTKEVYNLAISQIMKSLCDCTYDGILMSLHGAMVAEGHPDGEGDLLELVRQRVGPDIPIIVTLDLHANVTEKMVKNATILIPYENYPHTDTYSTGYLAASIMYKILTKEINVKKDIDIYLICCLFIPLLFRR